MIIIIDTNIIISACLNENSEISKLVKNRSGNIDFLIPDYALEEINKHKLALCKNTGYSIVQFERLLYQCCENASIFSVADIPTDIFQQAAELTRNIDINDKAFVAFSIAFDALIWTGDLKLKNGLKKAGFLNIISTKEFKDTLKGL